MASDNEASCVSDPNFAVICSFLECFGKPCGIDYPDIAKLQAMLENTHEVPQQLIDLHIKLLRKTRKSVSPEKWERALVKFCHTYSNQDGWELERFGYKKARTAVKLRLLKVLLETQFDLNQKFKNEVNKLQANELRLEPMGRDKTGLAYWFQLDEDCNIRVYREDLDEESWELVAKDRESVVELISTLSDGEVGPIPINEDSNSLEISEKPIIDTGQVVTSSPSLDENTIEENGDANAEREKILVEEKPNNIVNKVIKGIQNKINPVDEEDDDNDDDDDDEDEDDDNDDDEVEDDDEGAEEEDLSNDEASRGDSEEENESQDDLEPTLTASKSINQVQKPSNHANTWPKLVITGPEEHKSEVEKEIPKPSVIKPLSIESTSLKSIETPVITTSPLKFANVLEVEQPLNDKILDTPVIPIPTMKPVIEETKVFDKPGKSMHPYLMEPLMGHGKFGLKPIDQLAANLVRMQSEKLEKPSASKLLEKIAENLARTSGAHGSALNGEEDKLPPDFHSRSRGMDLSTSPRGWETSNDLNRPVDFSGMDLSSRKLSKSTDLSTSYRPQDFQHREMDLSTRKLKPELPNLSYDPRASLMRNHTMVTDLSKRQMPFGAYDMLPSAYHSAGRQTGKEEHRLPSYTILPDPSKLASMRMPASKRPMEMESTQQELLKRLRTDLMPVRGPIDKRAALTAGFRRDDVGPAIEEPLMMVQGEGSGSDCDAGNPEFGEVIEEPVRFFYGEGSGRECETGNPGDETSSDNSESNESKNEGCTEVTTGISQTKISEDNAAEITGMMDSDNRSVTTSNCQSSDAATSESPKSKFKPTLGVQVITKSSAGVVKRLSRWDVKEPEDKAECDSSIISGGEKNISLQADSNNADHEEEPKSSLQDERVVEKVNTEIDDITSTTNQSLFSSTNDSGIENREESSGAHCDNSNAVESKEVEMNDSSDKMDTESSWEPPRFFFGPNCISYTSEANEKKSEYSGSIFSSHSVKSIIDENTDQPKNADILADSQESSAPVFETKIAEADSRNSEKAASIDQDILESEPSSVIDSNERFNVEAKSEIEMPESSDTLSSCQEYRPDISETERSTSQELEKLEQIDSTTENLKTDTEELENPMKLLETSEVISAAVNSKLEPQETSTDGNSVKILDEKKNEEPMDTSIPKIVKKIQESESVLKVDDGKSLESEGMLGPVAMKRVEVSSESVKSFQELDPQVGQTLEVAQFSTKIQDKIISAKGPTPEPAEIKLTTADDLDGVPTSIPSSSQTMFDSEISRLSEKTIITSEGGNRRLEIVDSTYPDDVSENQSVSADQDSNEAMVIDDRASDASNSNDSMKESEHIVPELSSSVAKETQNIEETIKTSEIDNHEIPTEESSSVCQHDVSLSEGVSVSSFVENIDRKPDDLFEEQQPEALGKLNDRDDNKNRLISQQLPMIKTSNATMEEDELIVSTTDKETIVPTESTILESPILDSHPHPSLISQASLVANYDSDESNDAGSDDVFEIETFDTTESQDSHFGYSESIVEPAVILEKNTTKPEKISGADVSDSGKITEPITSELEQSAKTDITITSDSVKSTKSSVSYPEINTELIASDPGKLTENIASNLVESKRIIVSDEEQNTSIFETKIETIASDEVKNTETVVSDSEIKTESIELVPEKSAQNIASNIVESTRTMISDGEQDTSVFEMKTETIASDAVRNTITVASDPENNIETVTSDSEKNIETVTSKSEKNVETVTSDSEKNMETITSDPVKNTEMIPSNAGISIETITSEPMENTKTLVTDPESSMGVIPSNPESNTDNIPSSPETNAEIIAFEPVKNTELIASDPMENFETIARDPVGIIKTLESDPEKNAEAIVYDPQKSIETAVADPVENLESIPDDLREAIATGAPVELPSIRESMSEIKDSGKIEKDSENIEEPLGIKNIKAPEPEEKIEKFDDNDDIEDAFDDHKDDSPFEVADHDIDKIAEILNEDSQDDPVGEIDQVKFEETEHKVSIETLMKEIKSDTQVSEVLPEKIEKIKEENQQQTSKLNTEQSLVIVTQSERNLRKDRDSDDEINSIMQISKRPRTESDDLEENLNSECVDDVSKTTQLPMRLPLEACKNEPTIDLSIDQKENFIHAISQPTFIKESFEMRFEKSQSEECSFKAKEEQLSILPECKPSLSVSLAKVESNTDSINESLSIEADVKKEASKRLHGLDSEDRPPLKSKPSDTDFVKNEPFKNDITMVNEKPRKSSDKPELSELSNLLPLEKLETDMKPAEIYQVCSNNLEKSAPIVQDTLKPADFSLDEKKPFEEDSEDSIGVDNECMFESSMNNVGSHEENDNGEDITKTVDLESTDSKLGIRMKSVSDQQYEGWKLDSTELPATPKVSRKRRNSTHESNSDDGTTRQDNEENTGGKRIKLRGKRTPDMKLRKSVEDSRIEGVSSDEESTAAPKLVLASERDNEIDGNVEAESSVKPKSKGKTKGRKRRGLKSKRRISHQKKSDPSSLAVDAPMQNSDGTQLDDTGSTPTARKKRKKRKMVLGLEIGIDIIEPGAHGGQIDENPVRQSRRIAQQKIKEEADRRRIEEETLDDMKEKGGGSEKKKRKKQKQESDEDVVIKEVDRGLKIKKKRKKKKKKEAKFNEAKPWQSSSGTSSDDNNQNDEDDYEEEEIESEGSLLFKSDHEFSPESDLEKDSESEPMRRARTAQKSQDAVEEAEDEYACQKCGKADHPEWILLCDTCDKGWHCSCLRPAIMLIPEGDWFCPPCQHNLLVNKLRESLKTYDQNAKKHENEVLRKKRLAFVGISLDNVLPKGEVHRGRKDSRGSSSDESDNDNNNSDSDNGSEDGSSSSSSESGSSTSASSSEEEEPVYQLRERRCANTYKFNEYDDMINAAIQDEVEAVQGAGNQGRGKDISTIVNAEKVEAQVGGFEKQAEEEDEDEGDKQSEKESDKEYHVDKDEDVDDEEEEPKRKVISKKLLSRKKHRKLNSLDISSEDDPESDEDFKGNSSDEDEDYEDQGVSSSDDSFTASRRKGKRGDARAVRRSTRAARKTRYDEDFINDDSDESDKPKRKKSRSAWDEDSESEGSDNSWRSRKKKSKTSSLPRFRPAPKVKSKNKKKKRKRVIQHEDSDNQSENENEMDQKVENVAEAVEVEKPVTTYPPELKPELNIVPDTKEILAGSETIENQINEENHQQQHVPVITEPLTKVEATHQDSEEQPLPYAELQQELLQPEPQLQIPEQMQHIPQPQPIEEYTEKKKEKKKRGPVMRRKIVYGGLPDDRPNEDEEPLGRRTRGRKINYHVDSIMSDSEEELKKALRKTESEDEFVVETGEEVPDDNDKDSDSGDIYSPQKGAPKHKSPKNRRSKKSPAGRKSISDNGEPKPRKKPGPKPGSKNKPRTSKTSLSLDGSVIGDVPEGSLPGLGPGELGEFDDEQLEQMMMEDEEYGRRQLELAAIEIAKNKKKEEREAKKLEKARQKALEILAAEQQRDLNAPEGFDGETPKKKKRGRRSKAEILAEQMRRDGAPQLGVLPPAIMPTNIPMILNPALSGLPPVAAMMPGELERPEGHIPIIAGPDGQLFSPDGSPMKPKRRGRGKGKKTLALEAARAAEAAAARAAEAGLTGADINIELKHDDIPNVLPTPGSSTSGSAPSTPPALAVGSQGLPPGQSSNPQSVYPQLPSQQSSVITRMLQSQPVSSNPQQSFTAAAAAMGQKYFGLPNPGGPMMPGPRSPYDLPPRGRIPSPYNSRQQTALPPHFAAVRSGTPPMRMRVPGPTQLYHSGHHPMDPSPSGGGPISITSRDRSSPLGPGPAMIPSSAGSPLAKGGPTPPPPPYVRGGPPLSRFADNPQLGSRHPIPPFTTASSVNHAMQQPSPPPNRPGNFSPYHPQPPPNYHYGAYPPPPPMSTAEDAAAYQGSPYSAEHFATPPENPPHPPAPSIASPSAPQVTQAPPVQTHSHPHPHSANEPGTGPPPVHGPAHGPPGHGKQYDEEGSGEFGGLVSYFSSQREDDLDS